MKALRLTLQILLPLVILAGAGLLALWIVSQRPVPEVEADAFVGPIVRTVTAAAEDVRIDVETQGTVEAFRGIDLAPQVGGRVIEVSPALRAGGFFAAGEVLLKIDPADYELAVVQQEAAVARAELRVLQEKAESEAAIRAWQKLEGDRPADDLVKRIPQIADAERSLAAAQAMLDRARLDVDRTSVTAPFAGRVRSANVDLGQLVAPGVPVARIYGIDAAEVRLPLPASDVAFLDLPLHWRDAEREAAGPPVDLVAEFAGRRATYRGVVVRTEGEIDRKTRQLTVVARVEAPYARGESGDRPPLLSGMFVEATIRGRTFRGVIPLPRAALRGENEVWVLDAENRLRRRKVGILRLEPERVLVDGGLEPGDVICTTAIDTPVEGMPVRLFSERSENRDG